MSGSPNRPEQGVLSEDEEPASPPTNAAGRWTVRRDEDGPGASSSATPAETLNAEAEAAGAEGSEQDEADREGSQQSPEESEPSAALDGSWAPVRREPAPSATADAESQGDAPDERPDAEDPQDERPDEPSGAAEGEDGEEQAAASQDEPADDEAEPDEPVSSGEAPQAGASDRDAEAAPERKAEQTGEREMPESARQWYADVPQSPSPEATASEPERPRKPDVSENEAPAGTRTEPTPPSPGTSAAPRTEAAPSGTVSAEPRAQAPIGPRTEDDPSDTTSPEPTSLAEPHTDSGPSRTASGEFTPSAQPRAQASAEPHIEPTPPAEPRVQTEAEPHTEDDRSDTAPTEPRVQTEAEPYTEGGLPRTASGEFTPSARPRAQASAEPRTEEDLSDTAPPQPTSPARPRAQAPAGPRTEDDFSGTVSRGPAPSAGPRTRSSSDSRAEAAPSTAVSPESRPSDEPRAQAPAAPRTGTAPGRPVPEEPAAERDRTDPGGAAPTRALLPSRRFAPPLADDDRWTVPEFRPYREERPSEPAGPPQALAEPRTSPPDDRRSRAHSAETPAPQSGALVPVAPPWEKPAAAEAGPQEAERTAPDRVPPESPRPAPEPERPGKGRRRALITAAVLAVLLVAAVTVQFVRPLPEPTLRLTLPSSHTFQGSAPVLPLPRSGQAVLDVEGIGTMGATQDQRPIPTASVAKVMTAYVFLKNHPLEPGEDGPTFTISAEEAARLPFRKKRGESHVDVRAGQRFTERKALEALMVVSANNIAHELARWDSGSISAFVAKMNATAKELGMHNTRYTDPSGYDSGTVSTAADQVKLLRAAMRIPAFAEIVAERVYDPEDGGPVRPAGNVLLGNYGIVGGKTGYTDAAGGNFVFAARRQVAGVDTLMIGAVMGQHGRAGSALDAMVVARHLVAAAQNALTSATLVEAGQPAAEIDDGLGGRTPLAAARPITVVGWPGLTVRLDVDGTPPKQGSQGRQVGAVLVGNDGAEPLRFPLELAQDLNGPGLLTRLTRLK